RPPAPTALAPGERLRVEQGARPLRSLRIPAGGGIGRVDFVIDAITVQGARAEPLDAQLEPAARGAIKIRAQLPRRRTRSHSDAPSVGGPQSKTHGAV